jgi:hypothetical protein
MSWLKETEIDLFREAEKMTHYEYDGNFQDLFEYHGNTTIEHKRKHAGVVVQHDWILFDSMEEASEYFFNRCG